MGMLCAVTFTANGQLHYADPGELRPEVGDKYRALGVVRSLTRSLRTVAFDAVYDADPRDTEPAG